MTEHENVAIFGVLGVERERGDTALHVQEQILLTRRVVRTEAIDFPRGILGHHEAIRPRILRDEDGFFENKLIEGASKPVFSGWIWRADQARGRPSHAPLDPERLLRSRIRHEQ